MLSYHCKDTLKETTKSFEAFCILEAYIQSFDLIIEPPLSTPQIAIIIPDTRNCNFDHKLEWLWYVCFQNSVGMANLNTDGVKV